MIIQSEDDIDRLEQQWGVNGTGNATPKAVGHDHKPAWHESLIRTDAGSPKPVFSNAIAALRNAPEWHGVLWRDEFALRTIAKKRTTWGYTGRWSELQDALATEWLQHNGILVSTDITARAVETVAEENCFHPVRDYLARLQWDGTLRIDTWLTKYAGVEDTPYARAISSKWLIGAIARVRRPGCKADNVLIAEGPQDIGKTTMLATLGGEFYTDEIADLGSKDSAMQLQGAWIIEIAELDALARAEVSKIKAFITRTTDRFRPPYGRRVIEAPRQCIFAGTVNHSEYLRDETGGRRFWPVFCNKIDIQALKRDRDQLWAEAQRRYYKGETWWLTDESVRQQALEQQAARYEGDPWDAVIAEWAEPRDSVTIDQILTTCLNKPSAQWTQADKKRIARCLQSAGWVRRQQRIDGRREWRYQRKNQPPVTT